MEIVEGVVRLVRLKAGCGRHPQALPPFRDHALGGVFVAYLVENPAAHRVGAAGAPAGGREVAPPSHLEPEEGNRPRPGTVAVELPEDAVPQDAGDRLVL